MGLGRGGMMGMGRGGWFDDGRKGSRGGGEVEREGFVYFLLDF